MAVAPTFTEAEVNEVTQMNREDYDPGYYNVGTFNELLDKNNVRGAEVLRRLEQLKKEFEHERTETAKWRKSVDRKLDDICERFGVEDDSEDSQSLLQNGFPDPMLVVKKPPFVVITHRDGRTEDIYFSEVSTKDILTSTTLRELVRKILLHVHKLDIAQLRDFSLTGKSYKPARKVEPGFDLAESDSQLLSLDGNEDSSSTDKRSKSQLPIRTVLIVQEVVKKLHPINPTILKVDPTLAREQVAKQEQEVRAHITAVLNYFNAAYDTFGKIIQASPKEGTDKRGRKRRQQD